MFTHYKLGDFAKLTAHGLKKGSFIQELPVSSPAFGDFAGLLPRWPSTPSADGYILFRSDTKSTIARFQWVCGELVTD